MTGNSGAGRPPPPTDPDPLSRIDRAFDAAIAPWKRAPGPVAILFSGGIDSGVLAWELRARPQTWLVTVGRAGSTDLVAAEAAAPAVGLPWRRHLLDDAELASAVSTLASEFVGLPAPRQTIFLALAVAVDRAEAPDLLCGQGADELFLGYAHFSGLDAEAARARADADLDRLLRDDWPRTERIARRMGRRIHAPYLDPEFRRAILEIPLPERLPSGEPKSLLRQWARRRGVPAVIADRPKSALQYGTGVDAWFRRRAPR